MEWNDKFRLSSQVLFSIILMLIGVVLLLNNFDVLELGPVWQYWPFVLVIIGINKIIQSAGISGVGEGIWLVFLGLWLYVSIYHVWGLGFRDTWPMLIVAWGLSMLWKAFFFHSRCEFTQEKVYGN